MGNRSKEILEQLLSGREPEERERLALAWERIAGGDPDSLPVLFALSDRFSLEAHAALVEEVRLMHASLEDMAREIGKGASVTVERTGASAKATGDHVQRFQALIPRLERIAGGQEEICRWLVMRVEESARNMEHTLGVAGKKNAKSENWAATIFFALMGSMVIAGGFWAGGELRGWRELERMDELMHLSTQGDQEATQEIRNRIQDYRERHKLIPAKAP